MGCRIQDVAKFSTKFIKSAPMDGNAKFYEVQLPPRKSKEPRNVNITAELRNKCITLAGSIGRLYPKVNNIVDMNTFTKRLNRKL
jgi:hypothetical protein